MARGESGKVRDSTQLQECGARRGPLPVHVQDSLTLLGAPPTIPAVIPCASRRVRRLAALVLACLVVALPAASISSPGSRFVARAQEEGQPTAPPTRTRRPTRTPRATALPTATPLPAGALRLTLAMEPPVPRAFEEAELVVDLLGLDDRPIEDVVIDVDVPPVLVAGSARPSVGDTARAGSLLRWRVPGLPPGGGARLRVGGVPDHPSRDELACVLLVSRAATVEQCLPFEVRPAAEPTDSAVGGGVPGAPPGEDLPVAPVGRGWADVLRQPQALAGWAMLLAGLAVLGGWMGATMGARSSDDPPSR